MKRDITELFCSIDDFCREIDRIETFKRIGCQRHPTRKPQLENSEIVSILLLFHQRFPVSLQTKLLSHFLKMFFVQFFHQNPILLRTLTIFRREPLLFHFSPCKNFKYFFESYLQLYRSEFPKLVVYHRFLELIPRVFSYVVLLLNALLDKADKVHFIDATALPVCHNKRISKHKVFKGLACRGKTSMGYFFGFKLHLVINRRGHLAGVQITPGNVDDRVPVRRIVKKLKGLLFADRGYISSSLFQALFMKGLKLITGIRTNMKNKLIDLNEKMMLRKKSISETVNDYLKNKMNISHTRHRSPSNAFVHILSTLVAYSLKPTKPSISLPSLIPSRGY